MTCLPIQLAENSRVFKLLNAQAFGTQGDGTVTYEDPFSAASAVEWFNGKDFKGTLQRLL